MKITLLVIGKTDAAYLREGMDEYVKRLKHYINFEIEVIKNENAIAEARVVIEPLTMLRQKKRATS